MAWSNKELISFGSLTVTDTGWEASRASTWYNFPIFRQFFPCVLPWARIDADQIQKTPPLPNLVVSVQHPEIQSIQKGKYFYKQFPPTSRRPVAHLISEPGGKAFVEPQVAPPTHCHQVAKPLGTMPSGQLDPIGQLDNVQWTIGQLDNWIKIVLFNVHFARQLTWCANSCATI